MNMRKLTMFGVSAVLAFACVACGSNAVSEPAPEVQTEAEPAPEAQNEATPEAQNEAQPAAEPEAAETAEDETEKTTDDESGDTAKEKLPDYEYPGPELFYYVLYDYLNTHLMEKNNEDEVSIPCPIIVYEDESNRDDILVYADFRIYSYYLDGDILKTSSGGSFPGCIHLKSTDAGYEVTDMELVEDGSSYTDSAKKIFGEHYDDFTKAIADTEETERIRAQIICNYVSANGLSVTGYQDYGWDPQSLPEENTDSFYSTLD